MQCPQGLEIFLLSWLPMFQEGLLVDTLAVKDASSCSICQGRLIVTTCSGSFWDNDLRFVELSSIACLPFEAFAPGSERRGMAVKGTPLAVTVGLTTGKVLAISCGKFVTLCNASCMLQEMSGIDRGSGGSRGCWAAHTWLLCVIFQIAGETLKCSLYLILGQNGRRVLHRHLGWFKVCMVNEVSLNGWLHGCRLHWENDLLKAAQRSDAAAMFVWFHGANGASESAGNP